MGEEESATGPAIRTLREQQGLSIRKLAELAHANASYLSQVERGLKAPTDRWLRDITEALGQNLANGGRS